MKKINLKNNKKKKFKIYFNKFLFFVFVLTISLLLTTNNLINKNNITKKEYVDYLLNKSYGKKSNDFIIKESVKLLSNINLDKPETLLDKKLLKNDVKIKKDTKDAKAKEDDYDESVYEKLTTYIENTTKQKKDPIIYLYNTHQLETYSSEGLENNNISPNVLMVSYLLSEGLNKEGINTIVEDTNISEFIKMSNLDSDSFYASTRIFLKNAFEKYPTLKYFIDLHRDSVSKDISTTSINNRSYARILFVLGTTNPNYQENEKLMKKLDEISDKFYPGLSRGIYYRPTPDWPDSYNQDLNSNIILIEVGAKENTIEEVSNTIEALKNIIKTYIKGENI